MGMFGPGPCVAEGYGRLTALIGRGRVRHAERAAPGPEGVR